MYTNVPCFLYVMVYMFALQYLARLSYDIKFVKIAEKTF